ncbi:TPA: antitoxin [Klebsiella pneumoniae]|nr:antitoxin [Klebsiella pneumoniae]
MTHPRQYGSCCTLTSRLQELRDLLAEGISSGEAKPWNKNAFLRNVRARVANERD